MTLENEPMPWCEYCQCYHYASARHITKDKPRVMTIDEEMANYYRRKQQEIDDTVEEISRHQLEDCLGSPDCKVCKSLERRLERARYFGD